MTATERILYVAYDGPVRRPLKRLFRCALGSSRRIPFGLLRGCQIPQVRLDCRLGIYEIHVQYAMANCLRPGHVMYDVGANFGFHALLASRLVGSTGQVIAFEPWPQNVIAMQDFLSMNNCCNVQCRQEAISAGTGSATFYGGSSLAQASLQHQEGPTTQVASVTLDEVVKTSKRPNFVLMDIEGAEVSALEGATGLISGSHPPTLLVEIHGAAELDAIRTKLRNVGYSLRLIRPPLARRGLYPIHILAEKPDCCGRINESLR